eukprot:2940991-Prymnesium_polylepis.1
MPSAATRRLSLSPRFPKPPAASLISPRCQGGYTPLIAAAFNGHADVTQLLLDAGADPKAKDTVRRCHAAVCSCVCVRCLRRRSRMVLAVGALSGGAESFVPPPRYIVCGSCLQNGSTAQDVAKKNRFYK